MIYQIMMRCGSFLIGVLDNATSIDSIYNLVNDSNGILLFSRIDYNRLHNDEFEKLKSLSAHPNISFLIGHTDMLFAANNKTNIDKLFISDWIVKQRCFEQVIINDTSYIIVNGSIQSKTISILQADWETDYDGKLGYAITMNDTKTSFFGYTVSINLNPLCFQSFGSSGLGPMITLAY